MIGKKLIAISGKEINLDFNMYAYEQLMNLLVKYADKGANIDLNPETFENLFLEVQKTSFLLSCRMVIFSGHCGFTMNEGMQPKHSYSEIRDLVNEAENDELMAVLKFFWGTMMHEQEGDKEKKVQKPVSKKKVSVTEKSKVSV
jgi:hypothetical protein